MTLQQLSLTLLTVLILSAGQVLFKLAAADLPNLADLSIRHLFAPKLVLALGLYGFATIAWLFVLRAVPLSMAYPFIASAFIFVPLLAHFWLDEPLRLSNLIGAALIFAGVWVSHLGSG
jgi:drug/metabolite transporter (DMT)-like permease